MNPLLFSGLGIAAVALLILEGRRSDRRHLLLRGIWTVAAIFALGMLAAPPAQQENASSGPDEVALWTQGAISVTGDTRFPLTFALPEAVANAPSGARPIPDLGTLRRHFPDLHTLHLYGDGIDPAELSELAGLRVVLPKTERSHVKKPAVGFLDAPGEIALGETLMVSGRVVGLASGGSVPVTLEAPDGKKTEGTAGPADEHGEAVFDLRADPLPATGQYEWRLRAGATDERLGVSVVPPLLPRVLVLEASPHFDTAALRRWYADSAGTMTVRTRVGADRFRYAAVPGAPIPFKALDAALLKGFDLVLADRDALLAFRPEETAALSSAIHDGGLGLLVRNGDAADPKNAPPGPALSSSLLPWNLVAAASPDEEHLVRLRWPGQAVFSDVPLTSAPYSFDLSATQRLLMDDRQGRALAAATDLGRGQVALTLVGDTSRLLRENNSAAFSALWSFLFSSLARPRSGETGHWRLANAAPGPLFVDHPLELGWSGSASAGPGNVTVTQIHGGKPIPLALAQDATEPGQWQGTFWPREAGWHRVAAGNGSSRLDFYVVPADAWPELQTTARRAATTRFALESNGEIRPQAPHPVQTSSSTAGWFALLVLAVSYLWLERRFAGGV